MRYCAASVVSTDYGNPSTPLFLCRRTGWQLYARRRGTGNRPVFVVATDPGIGKKDWNAVIRASRTLRAVNHLWGGFAGSGAEYSATGGNGRRFPGQSARWRAWPAPNRGNSNHSALLDRASYWRFPEDIPGCGSATG